MTYDEESLASLIDITWAVHDGGKKGALGRSDMRKFAVDILQKHGASGQYNETIFNNAFETYGTD